MTGGGERWIRFLRQYGPVPRNDNMFDEHIRRSAARLGVRTLVFPHPMAAAVLEAFGPSGPTPGATVLTGTAGDGKSNLCGQVWRAAGGSAETWASDEVYFAAAMPGSAKTLHVIRDLTALPARDPSGRYASKAELLERLSLSIYGENDDAFLLAANDGQLLENWRSLTSEPGRRAAALFEARLMADADPEPGPRLGFYNLSAVSSADVLTLSLDAMLGHEGWEACYVEAEADGFFGPSCPIRRNYELLRTPLVRDRLRSLFLLCDHDDLHTPIRRVLMLLANTLLGHPRAKDRLLAASDVKALVAKGDPSRASLFGNLFGANLTVTKRDALEIFDHLGRFGIGQETTNRIDNILIFGTEDELLRPYQETLLANDDLYGSTDRYRAAQAAYIETPEATTGDRHPFLDMLAEQRRRLFFTIPQDKAAELDLWRLTVFTGAGSYLDDVVGPLAVKGGRVPRQVLGTLVRGLNRIFTGMLVSSDRELLLATSLSSSGARVSQLLEDRISVAARGRTEKVEITSPAGFPSLDVHLPNGIVRSLRLNLTRYEFLTRVAKGALPGNFSRECYGDMLAFKSGLLAAAADRCGDEEDEATGIAFRLLDLDADGNPIEDVLEVGGV